MKRILCAAALAAALTFTGGDVMAHRLTVDPPGTGMVHNGKPLAKDLTPDHPKKDGSAASQGTNTACEAVPDHSAVTITGGTCPPA